MKNSMYLMIFYADGHSRNFGLELVKAPRAALMLLCGVLTLGSVISAYNFYQLINVRSSYSQTMQNLAVEQRKINEHLVSLENFEEKISFFLGGVLNDEETMDVNMDYSA